MENTRIVEAQRKTKLKADEIQLFKESFVIVPYQVSGFLNYTNNGYNNENINPNDFETFKRVWTGNDACVLSWKDSVSLVQQVNNEMEVKFQLGEVFCGAIQTNDSENRIQTDASFSEYKSQDIKKTVNFYVNKHFKITDYYLLMFYKIPEYSGSTLYRLANIERDYVGRELVGYVLTFETINQDLANTGKAKQQNIEPNSPGQGYLECVVKQKDWWENLPDEVKNNLVAGKDYYEFYDRYITADFEKTKNRPVSKICVKLFGTNILSCVVCEGRPVYRGDSFTKWRAQRLIFPINFGVPPTPNLYATQNNVNNFYFGGFTPTLEYWQDLMTNMKNNLTPVNKWNYQGWLLYNYSKLQSTNPKVGTDGYKYTLYDRNWAPHLDELEINTDGVYGCATKYNIGGTKRIENHMWDNFWTQKQIKTLPISIEENLSYGNTIMGGLSLLGSGLFGLDKINPIMNVLNIGIKTVLGVIGLAFTLQQKLKKRLQSFRGLIPAAVLDFNNSLFGRQQGKIPFNVLNTNNNTETPNEIFFDGSTINTSFKAELTDRFTTPTVSGSLSTVNIGQTTFEDGTNILSTGKQYLVDGSETLISSKDEYEGYIIDSFKIQTVFNGDVSVEFLDYNDEVLWSGVYQSEGKWTKSMREVWTEKNTSVFGRENAYFTNPIPYPKPIPNIDGSLVDVDKLEDFFISTETIAGNIKINNTNEKIYIDFEKEREFNLTSLSNKTVGHNYFRINFQFDKKSPSFTTKQKIIDYQNNIYNVNNFEQYKVAFPQLQFWLGYHLFFTNCNFYITERQNHFVHTQTVNNEYIVIGDMDLNVEYDITNQFIDWNEYVESKEIPMGEDGGYGDSYNHWWTWVEFYKATPWKQFKIMLFEENNALYLQISFDWKEQWDKNSALYPKLMLFDDILTNSIYVFPNGFFDDRMVLNIYSICRKE